LPRDKLGVENFRLPRGKPGVESFCEWNLAHGRKRKKKEWNLAHGRVENIMEFGT